jgi:hypothetical protein
MGIDYPLGPDWVANTRIELMTNIRRNAMLTSSEMGIRVCSVSFADLRGVRHSVEVEAESLYEAAILGVKRLRNDPWIERIGDATVIDVEVREPATKHALSLKQIERWLSGATANPSEASKKAKLKMLMIQG